MKNDQFAVYRVDRNSEGRDLWHLSYQEAVSRKLAIRIEHYRQMDIRPLLPGENAIALWKRISQNIFYFRTDIPSHLPYGIFQLYILGWLRMYLHRDDDRYRWVHL